MDLRVQCEPCQLWLSNAVLIISSQTAMVSIHATLIAFTTYLMSVEPSDTPFNWCAVFVRSVNCWGINGADPLVCLQSLTMTLTDLT